MYYSYAKVVIGFGNTRELLGESVVEKVPKIGSKTGVLSSEMGSVSRGSPLLGRSGSVVGTALRHVEQNRGEFSRTQEVFQLLMTGISGP